MDIPTYNIIKGYYNDDTKKDKRQLVYRYFRDNMIVENIRANGEVHTPPCLVDNMLDTLPVDFWTKKQTVYDSCCGKAAFQFCLIERFFNSLTHLSPVERIVFIINECLFINDLNHLNVEITIQLMELHCQYLVPDLDTKELKFNFSIGDALTQEHKRKYCLVVANPPYNNPNCLGNGGYPIYCKFIIKGIELAIPNGYILYVNPPAWRSPLLKNSRLKGLFNLMTHENQMVYLSMHPEKDGKKMFGCCVKYDYYLIKKTPCYDKTIIVDFDKNIVNMDLLKHFFIPNFAIDDVMSLIAQDDKPRLKMLRGRSTYTPRGKHMSAVPSDEFRYKCLHSTPKCGNRYYYSNIDKGHFGVAKVIFGRCGLFDAIVDLKGEYGLTDGAFGILIDSQEQGEMIKKALLSVKFKHILKANLYGNFCINYTIFENYRADFYLGFI